MAYIILSAFIYNVNGYINSYMYSGIMDIKGAAKDVIQTLYSEYEMCIRDRPWDL